MRIDVENFKKILFTVLFLVIILCVFAISEYNSIYGNCEDERVQLFNQSITPFNNNDLYPCENCLMFTVLTESHTIKRHFFPKETKPSPLYQDKDYLILKRCKIKGDDPTIIQITQK